MTYMCKRENIVDREDNVWESLTNIPNRLSPKSYVFEGLCVFP